MTIQYIFIEERIVSVFVADVFGTLEALTKIINMYNDSRCPLDVVDAAVGPITEEDVDIAQMFNGTWENR